MAWRQLADMIDTWLIGLQALAIYYILAPAEASSNLARYDGMLYSPLASPNGVATAG
jgi:hypothetical protein